VPSKNRRKENTAVIRTDPIQIKQEKQEIKFNYNMICPKCGLRHPDHITVCPECDLDLVPAT